MHSEEGLVGCDKGRRCRGGFREMQKDAEDFYNPNIMNREECSACEDSRVK